MRLLPFSWFAITLLPLAAADPAPSAETPSVSAQVDALQKMMENDTAPNRVQVLGNIPNLRTDIEKGDLQASMDILGQMSAALPTEKNLQDAIVALGNTLSASDNKLREAQDAHVGEVLDRATKAVQAAKAPKDLDAVLAEMRPLVSIGPPRSMARVYPASVESDVAAQLRANSYRALDDANTFVLRWQEYLSDVTVGDHAQATSILQQLYTRESPFMPLPRSELLELYRKERDFVSTMHGEPAPRIQASLADLEEIPLRSLDDLPSAIQSLRVFERQGGENSVGPLINSLVGLLNAKEAYDNGNYTGALQTASQSTNQFNGEWFPGVPEKLRAANAPPATDFRLQVVKLRNQIQLQSVQALVAAPNLPPKEDEPAVDYLQRVAAAEAKAGDWNSLLATLQVYQTTMPGPQPWLQDDMTGLRNYLVGVKMEKAGQTLDAMRCYRQALTSLGRYFSGDPAAERLNALKKSSPEDYKQLEQQTPPMEYFR